MRQQFGQCIIVRDTADTWFSCCTPAVRPFHIYKVNKEGRNLGCVCYSGFLFAFRIRGDEINPTQPKTRRELRK